MTETQTTCDEIIRRARLMRELDRAAREAQDAVHSRRERAIREALKARKVGV